MNNTIKVSEYIKPEHVLVWLYLNATQGGKENPQIKIVINKNKPYGYINSIAKLLGQRDEPSEKWFYEKNNMSTPISAELINGLLSDAKNELDYSLMKYIGYFNNVLIGLDFTEYPYLDMNSYIMKNPTRNCFVYLTNPEIRL